jgi:hypothetical protein
VVEKARWVTLDKWKMWLLQTPFHLERKFYYRVFHLPNSREQWGVPLFENLGTRAKGSLTIGGNQRWGEDKCSPQRKIETYGPAPRAKDGSWSYWTPIYMLN